MYFYTDPLAAAFMAREYGMLYTSSIWANVKVSPHDSMILAYDKERKIYPAIRADHAEFKLYIHSDSIEILKPMIRDLVTNTHNQYNRDNRPCSGLVSVIFNAGKSVYINTGERHNGKRDFCESVDSLKIIQRNNIPFFWPESEQ